MKIIKSIRPKGLTYVNDIGIEDFVDFKECNENWIQYRKKTENLTMEMIEDIKLHDKCVGQRDFCAAPKFIEFFTKPKFTRFEFEESTVCLNPTTCFSKIQEEIMASGWTTLDLS